MIDGICCSCGEDVPASTNLCPDCAEFLAAREAEGWGDYLGPQGYDRARDAYEEEICRADK